jgi:hypothetical protein
MNVKEGLERIVRSVTNFNEEKLPEALGELLNNTDLLGLLHKHGYAEFLTEYALVFSSEEDQGLKITYEAKVADVQVWSDKITSLDDLDQVGILYGLHIKVEQEVALMEFAGNVRVKFLRLNELLWLPELLRKMEQHLRLLNTAIEVYEISRSFTENKPRISDAERQTWGDQVTLSVQAVNEQVTIAVSTVMDSFAEITEINEEEKHDDTPKATRVAVITKLMRDSFTVYIQSFNNFENSTNQLVLDGLKMAKTSIANVLGPYKGKLLLASLAVLAGVLAANYQGAALASWEGFQTLWADSLNAAGDIYSHDSSQVHANVITGIIFTPFFLEWIKPHWGISYDIRRQLALQLDAAGVRSYNFKK